MMRNSTRRCSPVRLHLHQLEARDTPAGTVTATFAAGVLTLTGDDDSNQIQLMQLGTNTTVGATIYINPTLISKNIATNEGLLLHEALHLLGFDDADLQRGLGQTVDPNNTAGITKELKKDCVTGKGNDRIP